MANTDSSRSLKSSSSKLEASVSQSQMVDLTAGQLAVMKPISIFLDLENISDNNLLRIF